MQSESFALCLSCPYSILVRLHWGDGHSSVSEDVSDSVDSDMFLGVSLGLLVVVSGIGVPAHMAVRIMAVVRCFIQRLPLGFSSSSCMICRLREGFLP